MVFSENSYVKHQCISLSVPNPIQGYQTVLLFKFSVWSWHLSLQPSYPISKFILSGWTCALCLLSKRYIFTYINIGLKSKLGYEKSFKWREETKGNSWQWLLPTITKQTIQKRVKASWIIENHVSSIIKD